MFTNIVHTSSRIHAGSGKECTTVLLTISANGACLPPYIIYKSKHLYDTWCPKNVIRGAMFNRTDSGWIDEDRFYDYFKELFIPQTKHIQRPLLLIFDGHTSHLSLKTTRLAIENQIHLLCLPAHATHILQPLDVYTLKYVKTQWRSLLWDFNRKNSVKKLDKPAFVRLYSQLYNYALLPGHCSAAFGKAGVFPYDPRAIKRSKLVKASTDQPSSTSLPRSISVEFNFNDSHSDEENQRNETLTALSTVDPHRPRTLVKYPSDPALCRGKRERTKWIKLHSISHSARGRSTQQNRERSSSVATREAIDTLDSVLDATRSLVASTSNDPAPFTTASSITIIRSNLTSSPVNDNSVCLSIPTCKSAISWETLEQQPVICFSLANDRALSAIDDIVRKYFSSTSTTNSQKKKRLTTPDHGKTVTDIEELARTTLRKKKTAERKKPAKPRSKKNADAQPQQQQASTQVSSDANANSTSLPPIGANLHSLPPISYMMASSSSLIPPSAQTNHLSFTPLQNVPLGPAIQCLSCFNAIQPSETTANCYQCHALICWNCSSKIDQTYSSCHRCRSYYMSQQQPYFNNTQYAWTG